MNFTIIDAEQRSPEWFLARAGRLTGSKADCVTMKGKGSAESTTKRDYRLQLVCERLTGIPEQNGYMNADMQRGIDCEPLAIAAYEARTGEMVRQTGFLSHNEILAGCSIDGSMDGFTGILEIKNPKTSTHIGYLKNPQSLADQYENQIQHNLWITDAQWCDVVSFDNRLPEAMQMVIVRVVPKFTDYVAAALAFLTEVEAEIESLKKLAA